MRPTRCLPIFLILLTSLAHAHWTDHKDLPDWAQRGRLNWCLHYSRADKALVDLFLEHKQTLLHGSSFDSPETANYSAGQGLHYMPYVCSRTTTLQEIEKNPQLKGNMLIKADGTEFLAYNNPVRRYGTLYTPAWPEWVRERTRRVWDLPGTSAIFYDNAFFTGEDYHPAAVAAWQKWAPAHGVDPGPDGPIVSPASRLFASEGLTAYHRGLQQFCHQHNPPLPNAPNLGGGSGAGLAAIEAGAVDLVFYETMTHPPFANNAYAYKVGLAASHGKPTGMLAYLPEKVGETRGQRTWNEGMHAFFYPSSPMGEEFSLAVAEAVASGGTYIPCYNLFPSLPITDLTDPFNHRIYRELKQSYAFTSAAQSLYTAAQPGSDVGILYSTLVALQNTRAQAGQPLADALTAAGVPFEVFVTSDLPDGLGKTKTLIVQNLIYADDPTAAGLVEYIERGGRAILTGEFASANPVGLPLKSPAADRLRDAIGLVSRPVRQWTLDGMEPEGPTQVSVTGTEGKASLKFAGRPGRYSAYLTLIDESDGTSSFNFSVNGKPVYEGRLDIEDNAAHTHITPAFDLQPDNELQFSIHANAGERGRLQSIVLVRSDATTGIKLGAGQVLYLPHNLDALPSDKLVSLLQPQARLPRPDRVQLNLADLPSLKLRAAHLVNYDFRYEVEKRGEYSCDDGTAEARTFFGRPGVVLRKRLHLDRPDAVNQPVIRLRATATPAAAAEGAGLAITLNGRPAGRLTGDQIRGWTDLPIDPALLQTDNVIEVRADGDLDGLQKWIQVDIDTTTRAGNSEFSTDGGKTFTAADLSPDLREQTGEYLIRIMDLSPGLKPDPGNLARNPGFEQVETPHSETRLTVVPAKDVPVLVSGPPQPALAISPQLAPVWIEGRKQGNDTLYTIPQVTIYTVLLTGPRQSLEPIRAAQLKASTWTIPPVTTPLRSTVTNWTAFGSGFALDDTIAHTGRQSLRCENTTDTDLRGATQQLDFGDNGPTNLTITAWSRAENVSGPASPDYSVYVDATCNDGTVYNGNCARFNTGTHDWEQVTLKLNPPKPIKTMRLHLLFRKKTGTVWFDDLRLEAK
ncbi:MAG: hypothetical protein ABFE08_05025 [Armatimonadia bacterium]